MNYVTEEVHIATGVVFSGDKIQFDFHVCSTNLEMCVLLVIGSSGCFSLKAF